MSGIAPPIHALAIILSTLVVGHDLYARRVPNTIVLGVLAVAMAWHVAALIGWAAAPSISLAQSGLALAVALAAMLPFYAIGWMGAGDVKLMAVLGFLLGLKPLLIVWLLANTMVATQTILILMMRFAARRQPQLALLQTNWQHSALCQFIERPRQGRRGMPFAAYIGIGVFIWLSRVSCG